MWKYRTIYLAVILAAGAVYIATNQRHLFMLLIVLVVLPLCSLIQMMLSAHRIRIGCELQDACVIHQRIGMNIKCTYSGVLPFGRIRLLAMYDNLLFQTHEEQIIYLENGAERELYYEMPYISKDCGRIEMHFSKVIVYDVMGLFTKKVPVVQKHDFTIYPEVIDMEAGFTSLPNAKNLGEHYDQNRKGQDVTEVFSVREYRDGDSPKSIHWKLSSKLDQLVVREFSHPSNFDTLILYDTTFPSGDEDYHEVVNGVLGITASVSKSLVKQNHIHHVGCMSKTTFVHNLVEDNQSYMQTLTNMMSTTLATDDENVLDEFQKRDVAKEFTKIVLVTSDFDEYNIRRLSDFVDLTVVLISAEQEDNVEEGSNYNVITRNVEHLTTKKWILEI